MNPKQICVADTSTPVAVLRSVGYGGLNIIRSLGRLGVPVYNIDPNPFAPAFCSRYCRGRFVGDIERWPADRALDYLQKVGRKIGRPSILVPTTDAACIFVAENRSTLQEWFIFPQMPLGKVCSLANKKQMHQIAQQFRIPAPETLFPQSREEIQAFAETGRFPVMLKGIDGTRLYRRTGQKMMIVRSQSELLKRYDEMDDAGNPNLMLQEYIPGEDDTIWIFNGYFNEKSECLAAYTGRKIRQYPVHKGVTSLGECAENPLVKEKTVEFLRAFGYRGIVDLGYRYDHRDGSYKILDINPRIGATFRMFVDNKGMDVARALYLDLTGQPVATGALRNGRRWIVEDFDFVSCVRYRLEGKLGLKSWLASLRGVEEAAYFAPDDLLPLLPMLFNDLHKLLAKSLEGIAGLLGLHRNAGWLRNKRTRIAAARKG